MLAENSADEIYGHCVDETRRFVTDAGFSDVVIGLSGGMDSSLVATMAVDAFGRDHVHGILLPGPYSSESSILDADQLASNLGIRTVNMSIDGAYDVFKSTFGDAYHAKLEGVASENTQARCRMVLIMAASNQFGWMMLNTGNKSEAAMGYSTLYGDTAGAFAPIGGLYKTDVFELARWRNAEALSKGQVAPIPRNVIDKPPSAELSPNQTDESSLGIDYPTLDRILVRYVEHGIGKGTEPSEDSGKPDDAAEIDASDPALVDKVLKRYRSFAFKRAMEPAYPKIGY